MHSLLSTNSHALRHDMQEQVHANNGGLPLPVYLDMVGQQRFTSPSASKNLQILTKINWRYCQLLPYLAIKKRIFSIVGATLC